MLYGVEIYPETYTTRAKDFGSNLEKMDSKNIESFFFLLAEITMGIMKPKIKFKGEIR